MGTEQSQGSFGKAFLLALEGILFIVGYWTVVFKFFYSAATRVSRYYPHSIELVNPPVYYIGILVGVVWTILCLPLFFFAARHVLRRLQPAEPLRTGSTKPPQT